MTKVIELEGRIVTIRFKQIEINGQEVVTPGEIAVQDRPLHAESDSTLPVTPPLTRPQKTE